MKIWTAEHVFKHPWETVVQAAWRKYPNPMNPGVVGVDVTERSLHSDGTLHSKRLLTTQWGIPGWAIKLVGMEDACYVHETSEVNAKERKMSLRSKNVTFARFVNLEEHVEYTPHPTDPNSTCFKQESVITVQGVPLTSYMETLIVRSATNNATKGKEAMDWICQKVKDEAADIRRNLETTRKNLETTLDRTLDNMKHLETNFDFDKL